MNDIESLEVLQAKARGLMRERPVDLDELGRIKSLLMSVVEDTTAPESDRMRAANTISEIVDFKISAILTAPPYRVEAVRQQQVDRLGRRIKHVERKNPKAPAGAVNRRRVED